MGHKSGIIVILFFIISFWSCDRNAIYEQSYEVNPEGWPYDKTLKFNYSITDSSLLYTIYLIIDHNKDYSYQNIYFKTKYNKEGSSTKEDIFSVNVASRTGRWLGNCFSDRCHYEVVLQPHVKYDQIGDYQFELIQNTRDSLLMGVEKVGLRIEREE